jgi:hypothetical protein
MVINLQLCFYVVSVGWVQVNQDGLKLKGTLQLLVCADVNMLEGSIHTVKRNTNTLLDAGKEIGLVVNTGAIKYMVMSSDQNVD